MNIYEYKDKTMIYKFIQYNRLQKSARVKRGRVLDMRYLRFNDKPENVTNLLSYGGGGLNNLFYETMLNNLMLDIISRLCNRMASSHA